MVALVGRDIGGREAALGIRVGFTSTGRGDIERLGSIDFGAEFLGRPFPLVRSEAYGEEYVRAR